MSRKFLASTRTARLTLICLVGFSASGSWGVASAATHYISSNTSTVDCDSYGGGIRPGDKIALDGTSRGPLTIRDCIGTEASPITIHNDTTERGPVVISKSSGTGGFVFELMNVRHVVVDGTGGWSGSFGTCSGLNSWPTVNTPGTCGIVVTATGGSPSVFLHMSGSTSHVVVKGVEVDGNFPAVGPTGSGVSVNGHNLVDSCYPYSSIHLSDACDWREGFELTDLYIHDTPHLGFYIGANYGTDPDDWKLRDINIHHNRVSETGVGAIAVKTCWGDASTCLVHHNYIENIGEAGKTVANGGLDHCVSLFESNGRAYNNWCRDNLSGINDRALILANVQSVPSSFGTFEVEIYNNLVHQSDGHGISIGKASGTAGIAPIIYNNTTVATAGSAISVSSSITSCTVQNNIAAGASINAGTCTLKNNNTQSVANQKFADSVAKDFRITALSPALKAGTTNCPSTDYVGTSRPRGGACDQGAFEFADGEANLPPKPPSHLAAN